MQKEKLKRSEEQEDTAHRCRRWATWKAQKRLRVTSISKTGPPLTGSKEMGPRVLQAQETEFSQQSERVWQQILPQNLQKGLGPDETLILPLRDSDERTEASCAGFLTHRTGRQYICVVYKPLSLQELPMTVIKNKHRDLRINSFIPSACTGGETSLSRAISQNRKVKNTRSRDFCPSSTVTAHLAIHPPLAVTGTPLRPCWGCIRGAR